MRILMVALAAGLWLGSTAPGFARKMSVQVEQGQIREKPSVFGKVIMTVPYGERLEIEEKQLPWYQVETQEGVVGWIHESTLTKKKIELVAGAEDVGRAASSEELAMAGKGFNSQVEADFKKKNSEINFEPIDKMEKYEVKDEEIREFLVEGGLGE